MVPVSDFTKDTRFEGPLLVRSAEQRAASNGSRYLDMMLGDRTGDVNAKLWDGAYAPPAVGSIVKVRGQLLEYNGRLQLRVERMRMATDQDEVALENLVPCAPEKGEDMLAEVHAVVDSMRNEALQRLIRTLLKQAGDVLLTFPAAQRLHHAERGGLLHHTVGMLRLAHPFVDLYPVLDRDLLYAGIIAHDLAKISEMDADDLGTVSEYTPEGLLIGHLVRGVVNIELAGREADVDTHTMLLLQHMVLSHHGEPEYGSPRKPMFPEAEILHQIDLIDARMNEMSAALKRVRPGGFTEKIWSLDRRLYRIDRGEEIE